MDERVLERLGEIGLIPVVVLEDADKAVPLARALLEGGVSTAEVTFRTAAAAEAIAAINREVPQLLVGAGTITDIDKARLAQQAGAKYLVSPGLNAELVRWCAENDLPIIPGVATPSEVMVAASLGVRMMKFFPAEQSGGVPALKALAGPFNTIRFVATGGIDAGNMQSYLACRNVAAVGGGWLAASAAVKAGDFAAVTTACRTAVDRLHGFELLHIGINAESDAEARQIADMFCMMFGFARSETPNAYFAGSAVEVMKTPYFSPMGHIGFACNNVERAAAYFRERGFAFLQEGCVQDEKGLKLLYFEKPVGGFSIHLRRKD